MKIFLITIMFVSVFYFTAQTFCYANTSKLNNTLVLYTKEPISKKKIAYKFILAMMGVMASSVVIYVCLTIYNKFTAGTPTPIGLNKSKSTGKLDDSIKLFVDKTNWD